MIRVALIKLLGGTLLSVGLLAAVDVQSTSAQEYAYPQMMQNYYVADPQMGIQPEMYLAPVPTPPLVGRTYITYSPLNPHEFLYRHHRTYYQYYDGGRGLNRTKIHWYGGRSLFRH